MLKYPIIAADEIAAFEKEYGAPLNDNIRELITLMTKLENKAYEQGLNAGFLKAFDRATEEKKGIITEETPEEDTELQEALMELRIQLESDFESDGFTTVLNNLNPIPPDMNWGEKIYAMTREAFVVGGFIALWDHIQKGESNNA